MGSPLAALLSSKHAGFPRGHGTEASWAPRKDASSHDVLNQFETYSEKQGGKKGVKFTHTGQGRSWRKAYSA